MEIIVVIIIIGLTAGYAVPGMISFVNNQKADSAALRLAEAFRQARSLSIDRNQTVSVCPITPSSSCTTTLTSCACIASTDWTAWKVYSNNLGNVKFYGNVNSGTITAASTDVISFNSMGIPTATQTFTIKPTGCTGNNGRSVTVSVNGYVQILNISC
jgi:Tfp pilus assembly protein FimT